MKAVSFDKRDISPVTTGDCIHRANVVSKTFVCPNNKADEALGNFLKEILDAGHVPVGLPFFVTEPDLESGWTKLQFYISIEHTDPLLPDNLHFNSYFSVDSMASLCVACNPEKNMSEAYVRLTDYLRKNSLAPVTPIFQILGGDADTQYTFLKVGYRAE
jgi:hypothetical protein